MWILVTNTIRKPISESRTFTLNLIDYYLCKYLMILIYEIM